MERQIVVSTGEGIGVLSPDGRMQQAALHGAGALCMADAHLFCACEGGREIWRLDRRTLMPQALYPGGPGVCDLCLSGDGRRLYALCADADSVLMLEARSGRPQLLSRAGCNPRKMALSADTLAIAGGESGCVHLLDAQTLEPRGLLSMPGPVYDAAIGQKVLYALCLTQTLDSLLVTQRPGGTPRVLALAGMPGCLLARAQDLLAATQSMLYRVSPDGGCVLERTHAPGRANRILETGGQLLACDLLSERLFARGAEGGEWRVACAAAKDAALM